ncbi:MAG: hypothetical protein H0W83_15795 [Planctomycetes bacterium]|nr:hypothetical protein [Planctomycetota bacterium]
MTLFAQHGSRRGGVTSTILVDGLRQGLVTGAIFSPANEEPDALDTLVSDCHEASPTAELMIDPQVYVATLSGTRDTKLKKYPWFPTKVLKPASFTLRATPKLVGAVLDWQYQRGVTTVVTPTVPITALDAEPYSQISYMMAQESCAHHAEQGVGKPLLVTLLIREDALQRTEAVREFVDRLRVLDPAPAGFYVIVERLNPGYSQIFEERALANLLWCCHILGTLDGFRVVVGYTDLVGVLAQAAGAEATACGWHQSLRSFHRQRWMPSFGRTPRKRFTSMPLFDSLLINPEVLAVSHAGLFERIRSNTANDTRMPDEQAWTLTTSTMHHWASIGRGLTQVQAGKTPTERMERVEDLLRRGIALGKQIENKGIPFEQRSPASHLENWRRSIKLFRDAVRI